MKKKILSLTALVLIGASSFGVVFSATEIETSLETEVTGERKEEGYKQPRGSLYLDKEYHYINNYCPTVLKDKYKSVSVNGGTLYYGCTSSGADKASTKYKKDTGRAYSSFTFFNSSNYKYGSVEDFNAVSGPAKVKARNGYFYHKVLFYS